MKKSTFACVLGAATLVAGMGQAAELGAVDQPIKLAINEWTGQHVTTHIAGEMLKAAGYKVEYVTAGTSSKRLPMARSTQRWRSGPPTSPMNMPSRFLRAALSIWAIWNWPPKKALPIPLMWRSFVPVCLPGKP